MSEKVDPEALHLGALLDRVSASARDAEKVEISVKDIFYLANIAYIGVMAVFEHLGPAARRSEVSAAVGERVAELGQILAETYETTDRAKIEAYACLFASATQQVILDRFAHLIGLEEDDEPADAE